MCNTSFKVEESRDKFVTEKLMPKDNFLNILWLF